MKFGITPELLAHVKREEGWRAKPYLCPAGKPTIGYGQRIKTLDHAPITKAQGEALLIAALELRQERMLKLSPVLAWEPEIRASAVLDFCYNAGTAAYASSTLRKRVNEGKWEDAAREMRRWVYATDPATGKKRKLSALVKRRDITAGWLERGTA